MAGEENNNNTGSSKSDDDSLRRQQQQQQDIQLTPFLTASNNHKKSPPQKVVSKQQVEMQTLKRKRVVDVCNERGDEGTLSSDELDIETETEELYESRADEDEEAEADELYGLAESDNLLVNFHGDNDDDNEAKKLLKLSSGSSTSSSTSSAGDSQSMTNFSSSTDQQNKSGQSADFYLTPPMRRAASMEQTMVHLGAEIRKAHASSRGFEIVWENLNYSYKRGLVDSLVKISTRNSELETAQSEHILKDLSGSVSSNQLVALVGPSGCGKTTLLQLLSGNMPIQEGRLTIRGLSEPRVSFIGQHDPLLPDLTAQETLVYASRLQNTRANFGHTQHVQPIIQALGLAECAHRNVQQLSGGQLKRVCIAQELLYPTDLLILDEITSGLDASTSYSIIKQLRKLTSDCNYPMTIVVSIHQPSARLFAVFDKVYVMSAGRCLYEGSCEIELINAHLRSFNLECSKFTNIADFLIEIASDDADQANECREKLFKYHDKLSSSSSTQAETRIRIEGGAAPVPVPATTTTDTKLPQQQTTEPRNPQHSQSRHPKNITKTHSFLLGGCEGIATPKHEELASGSEPARSLYDAIEKARARRQRPFLTHMLVHFERSSQRLRRSYIFTYMQLITYAILGIQLTTFFGPNIGKLSGCPQLPLSFISYVLSSSDSDDESASLEMRRIQENVNFMLVVVMTVTFAALEITVITFPLEAKTVKREWRNGRYRVSSYFVGRTMADLPIQIACVLLFSMLTYSQTSQHGLFTWRFFSYCTILICCGLVAQTVGFLFGAIFMDSLPLAVFTAPLSIFPALLFSGFFARMNQTTSFYASISRLSHFRYAFEALIITLYGYGRCGCDQNTLGQYHASLESQTNTMREMFKTMLGAPGCLSPGSSTTSPLDLSNNNIEDTTGFLGDIDSFVGRDLATTTMAPRDLNLSSLINSTTTTTTTERPMKAFEDALIDSVYAHMNSSSEGTTPASSGSAVDIVMSKFTTKLTKMFNSRSNFGRPVPENCTHFNSYLVSEFELKDHDLIEALIILFLIVVVFRIVCNVLLAMTMRAKIC